MEASEIISLLGLQPHPEGGWYRRVYESDTTLEGGQRCGSAIYYLLCEGEFSAFHRLGQDELLHHYLGASLSVHQFRDGGYQAVVLGGDLLAGQRPQLPVRAGTTYAIVPEPGQGWALIGCTVYPEFRFETFSVPTAQELIGTYPRYKELIERYTRG